MNENLREATELPEKSETAAAEADEPKTRNIRFKVSAYDPRGIEQWLSERAAEGEFLLRGSDFTRGAPCECRYHLEPARDDDDPDDHLRETRAQMGWDYVCRTQDGIFYIWRGDKTARAPSPRPCTDSYAYRRLRKKMRGSYLMPLISLASFAAIIYIAVCLPELPVLSLLTMAKNTALQIAALFLGGLLALLSDAQERREMRALKRAMEDCERTEKMRRNRWARLNRLFGVVMSVLPLILLVSVGSSSPYSDEYDEPPLPYLRAEELGGRAYDWCDVRDFSTPLGGHVYSVGETPYAGKIDDWWQYSTEVDFYAPRISALAEPLTQELRDYFIGGGAQALSLDGFDEAYYAEFIKPNTRFPNEPDEVHQFLILRRGGEVLYFRTEAPDDLREHLDEFAAIFDQYSELS